MTYSFGRRMEEGADRSKLLRHLVKRAGILTVTSWIIISVETNHLHLQAHNVLIQVAATSLVCFFLMQLPFWYQMGAAVLLLAFHSSLYLIFPGPDGAFQPVTNFGAVLDRAIMGHNYRMAPCVNLNTIPEVVNVLIGIWIGNLLRSPRSLSEKFKWMIGGMLIAFAAGLALSPHRADQQVVVDCVVCPLHKRMGDFRINSFLLACRDLQHSAAYVFPGGRRNEFAVCLLRGRDTSRLA